MEIKPLEFITDHQAKKMFGWLNDPSNRFYSSLCKDPDAPSKYPDWQSYQKGMNSPMSHRYGIFDDGEFVGEFNFVFDHPALLKKEPKSAWIGIGIGEESARRKGFGTIAMEHLEAEVKKAGGKRIELGVFDYNKGAIQLYEKLGYHHFETIPEFTWWEGAKWASLHYEKFLY